MKHGHTMKTDPLIRQAKRAYRQSDQYVLDQLLAEESKWKRRATICSNKLADVRAEINMFAKERVRK